MRFGAVVLCGGDSRRMGQSKANLPFGDEVMLTRVLRLLGKVAEPLVVVAADGQPLPDLPKSISVARDRVAGRGPLEGLYVGLAALSALPNATEIAYVTACDVPLLRAEFVQYLVAQSPGYDVVVPTEGKFFHPLSAVYRTDLTSAIESQIAQNRLRMISFYEQVGTHRIDTEELKSVDPDLHSLMNLNSPEDYQMALRLAGFSGGETRK